MQRLENRLVVLLLALLAGLSSLSIYYIQQHAEKDKDYGNYPDSMAFNIQLMNFDQSGALSQIIHSKQALHYPNSKQTDFTDVGIQILNQKNNPPWFISAPSATVNDQGNVVVMQGPVNMQQAAYPDHFATTLATHDVSIFTDKKYLTTEAPVEMLQTGLQIDALGAGYDYDHQILNLFHQTRVVYQAKSRGK